jgi:antitoxin CcdA
MPLHLAQHSRTALKKAVTLRLDGELLRLGKELGLDLSSLAEEALAGAVKAKLGQQWMEENAGAIEAYNQRVETHRVFSDKVRTF